MRRIIIIITAIITVVLLYSCDNNPKPAEGKFYVKADKGLLLPAPSEKGSSKFDYKQYKVSFESDGVYLRSKKFLKNPMISIVFTEPQFKPVLGHSEPRVNIGLNFNDEQSGWKVYKAEYGEFRKYAPFWTWEEVESIVFRYEPEGYEHQEINLLDYENIEDFKSDYMAKGFDYTCIIYRQAKDMIKLNDPDFDEVFQLFRAYTRD